VWIEVVSGPDRGRAVEVRDEPATIGSGTGCALVVHGAGVEPLHASARALPDGGVEVTEHGGATHALHAGEELTLGDDALVRVSAQEPAGHDAAPDPALERALSQADPPSAGTRRRTLRAAVSEARRATALAVVALALAVAVAAFALLRSTGGDPGPNVEDVVKAASSGTLRVTTRAAGERATGSGWVLDERRGLVVTNFHVVNRGETFTVNLSGAERDAKLVGASPCDDIALLEVGDRGGLRALALGRQKDVRQGEPVIAIGYPANGAEGGDLSSTTGVVSVAHTRLRSPNPEAPDFDNVIQTDAAINPGNSGGPLLDEHRRVIGVNTAVLLQSGGVPIQNTGYAIGIDRVREVARDLQHRRSSGWPGFGLLFPTRAQRLAARLPAGVVASGSVPGTPAGRDGIGHEPVLVTAVDGIPVEGTMRSWCETAGTKHSGEDAELTVRNVRTGKSRIVRLRFA
jgi:S1-C subfamily serine protease